MMALKETLMQPRTDDDVFGRKPIIVQMAGRDYEIKPAPRARGRRFRHALKELGEFAGHITEIITAVMAAEDEAKIDLVTISAAARVLITEKLDVAFDLVYAYCGNIEADKELLEDPETGATDEEFLAALFAVIKVSSGPFARALGLNGAKGSSLSEQLSRLGVEYRKKQKRNVGSSIESTSSTGNDPTPSHMPGSQSNGISSPEKSTTS